VIAIERGLSTFSYVKNHEYESDGRFGGINKREMTDQTTVCEKQHPTPTPKIKQTI
jgi:hypothetical protein